MIRTWRIAQRATWKSRSIPDVCKRRTHSKSITDPVASLKSRGLVSDVTSPHLSDFLKTSTTSVYGGFDPTASSLHAGNLVLIIALLHFQLHGHRPIALIGGATGSIGDPSGRSTERNAMDEQIVMSNAESIKGQIDGVFGNANEYLRRRGKKEGMEGVRILNNLEWFRGMSMLEFLGDLGRNARVSLMLAKDSVKSRLESEEGISFTEFSYQLLQAYDFYHLFRTESCAVQLGGSDQWGNITAGIDLIRKKTNAEKNKKAEGRDKAFGLTLPLLTTSTGEKFGKSAGNAVWLSKEKLSVFDFYQFFRRTPDADVERYLKYFTFLSLEDIEVMMARHEKCPQNHEPQRKLAMEVTELVHGLESATRAEKMSRVLFDSDLDSLTAAEIFDAFAGDERIVELSYDTAIGSTIPDLVHASRATPSKSSARKLLASGGIYLNNKQLSQDTPTLQKDQLKDNCLCLLRVGKNQYRIIKLV
ncbi:tyrosine-tRNA ligase [Chytridium lagenaria]|nr:tyrosine-tRNA ligase [Chytridium lagenaria]